MHRFFGRFLESKRGATSIEYGLIALLISVAIAVALTSISVSVGDFYAAIVGAF
jgi:Flp pilus assembly pilin Flp